MIVDLGTSITKAGFSGEENPQLLLNSIYGKPKYKKILPSGVEDNITISPDDNIRSIFKVENIIERGNVTDYSKLQQLLLKIINQLKAV